MIFNNNNNNYWYSSDNNLSNNVDNRFLLLNNIIDSKTLSLNITDIDIDTKLTKYKERAIRLKDYQQIYDFKQQVKQLINDFFNKYKIKPNACLVPKEKEHIAIKANCGLQIIQIKEKEIKLCLI